MKVKSHIYVSNESPLTEPFELAFGIVLAVSYSHELKGGIGPLRHLRVKPVEKL